MRIPSALLRLLVIALCLLAATVTWGQPPAPSPRILAKQAAFIFEGQVEARRNTTLAVSDLPPRSIVARVVNVLYVKPAISVSKGDLVVVQLARPALLQPKTRAVFYTNGWIYGTHLTVRELGHTLPTQTSGSLQGDIAAAKAEAENDRIRERINAAEIVISGKVEAVRAFEERKGLPVSEHDADWRIAEVAVKQFLKGRSEKQLVLVAFPNSRDVMWAESPKFSTGQEGIWILARLKNLQPVFASLQQPVYTALNPRDFRETKDTELVLRLIKPPAKKK